MLKHHTDLLCFSDLPWSTARLSKYLMRAAAKECRVFFIEEPLVKSTHSKLEISCDSSGVRVVVPYLPSGLSEAESQHEFSLLLQRLLEYHQVKDYQLWASTPKPLPALMALANIHRPDLVIYDCSEERSAYLANPGLLEREDYLSAWADIIFTSTPALYQAKRKQHHHVFLFARNEDLPYRVDQKPLFPGYLGGISQQKAFIGFMNEEMQLEYIWHAMHKIMTRALADKRMFYPPARTTSGLRASR